jgi:3-oxoacyl-[acyl-carrier-protein] synthase II
MSSRQIRTVITGFGLLTPVGLGREAAWQGILSGKSAVKRISAFDPSGLQVQIGAELPGWDAKTFVDKKARKSLKTMGKAIQFGFAGGSMALQDAKISPADVDPTRLGISFGAATIASELDELTHAATKTVPPDSNQVNMKIWGVEGMTAMPPLWLLKYLPNFSAAHVSILQNAQGPSNSITMVDVGGNLAIAEARRIIQRGLADVMLTGGPDSRINPLSIVRMEMFYPLSRNNENPEEACRPFDRNRSGIVLGEGAGILVVEELEHAKKRNATIYAEIVGTGDACDVNGDGSGISRSIDAALKAAGISAADLDHVVAQGFGDKRFDKLEASGLRKSLGDGCPSVYAAKGAIGNTGAASGGIETAFSALALHHGVLPPSLNYRTPDPDCAVPVSTVQRTVTKYYSLKLCFSDLGQSSAIVLKRWQGQ